jgi:hypothetical protein
MRHVVAGCGFLLVLYFPIWWSMPSTHPAQDVGFALLPFTLAAYGGLAIAALAMYYALFRASGPSMLLLALRSHCDVLVPSLGRRAHKSGGWRACRSHTHASPDTQNLWRNIAC